LIEYLKRKICAVKCKEDVIKRPFFLLHAIIHTGWKNRSKKLLLSQVMRFKKVKFASLSKRLNLGRKNPKKTIKKVHENSTWKII